MDSGEMFLQVALLAYVLAQFTDALVKPLITVVNTFLGSFVIADRHQAVAERVRSASLLINLWPLYVTTIAGVFVARYTGLNLFPVFQDPKVGQLLTYVAIGLGPSFVHDLKPKSGGV